MDASHVRTPSPPVAVFDVDGTLVDSERHGHRVAFNDAFAAFDLPYVWDEATYGRLLAVAGGAERLRRFLVASGHDEPAAARLAGELHRYKTERFRERCALGQVPVRPGVGALLDDLAAADMPVAVATTGSRAWVGPLLERAFGLERFVHVLTGTEVARRKPAGDIYTTMCRDLAREPTEVVAIEDCANGLRAARAAGVPCLVVAGDYTRDEPFDGAALVVDGFCDTAVRHGPATWLDDAAVTARTVAAVATGATVNRPAPTPPRPRGAGRGCDGTPRPSTSSARRD